MSDDGVRVGIVGASPETVATPDGVVLTEDTDDVVVVVAVGERALLSAAAPSVPVLPVEAGAGVRSIPREHLTAALQYVAADDYETWTTRAFDVAVGDETLDTVLFDAMLVTEAPAHISEFTVETPTDRLASFRADGVLFATAPGTAGYARRVDAPVFDPGVPACSVVPVAPFATRLDHWVVGTTADPIVTVTIEREEATVELLADDRTVGPVPPHTPVTVSAGDRWTFCRVPVARSPFGQ